MGDLVFCRSIISARSHCKTLKITFVIQKLVIFFVNPWWEHNLVLPIDDADM